MNNSYDTLQSVPGIGPKISQKLHRLGIHHPQDLCGQDPQNLYDSYQKLVGHPVDRCLLYVFRCAVYYCETAEPEAERLKWWFWKDQRETESNPN